MVREYLRKRKPNQPPAFNQAAAKALRDRINALRELNGMPHRVAQTILNKTHAIAKKEFKNV